MVVTYRRPACGDAGRLPSFTDEIDLFRVQAGSVARRSVSSRFLSVRRPADDFGRRGRYTPCMRSVADEFRARDREALLKLSFEERLEIAFALGEEDLARFCQAQGVDRETGIRLLQRRRQAGRRPSNGMEELIG